MVDLMGKFKGRIGIFLPLIIALLVIAYLIKNPPNFSSKNSSGNNENQDLASYPVTVESCGKPVTFESAPERIMAFDTNMVEMLLALGLEKKMVGYWTSGVEVGSEYQEQIKNIPLVAGKIWPPPGMEIILNYTPDFIFGAWEYNFSEESGVNPDKLASVGIKSYVLGESCIAEGVEPNTTLESTYNDFINLGKIFNEDEKAQAIVDNMKARIDETQMAVGNVDKPLRGLYYGGGDKAAFSCGKYGMASKLMSTVGAVNILSDVEDDWIPEANWETIIKRDPQFIMIDDTPWESAEHRIATLESLPKLASITAIKEKRYIVFPWTYILPGMEMDEGVAFLAKNLYPDKFQ